VRVTWHPFDYADKTATKPPDDKLVWIYEDNYAHAVTLGYFDGFTFRFWTGSDDCYVTKWAFVDFPEAD
jgi:hypothetical protein